ncbi:MAG: hypothetical protein LC624_01025, partial [Halobacteriales archaeon]|nr:hypothetical protein [Halobacteriales archaeon]
ESFLGVRTLEVKWRASDPDGTVPVINLYTSSDGGATWSAIASPTGTSYAWDIGALQPGDWRVKVEATDGSLSNSDVSGKFRVDPSGLASANSLGGLNGQQGLANQPPGDQQPQGASPPGPASAIEGSPMVLIGFAAVLVVAGAALAVWKWRSR